MVYAKYFSFLMVNQVSDIWSVYFRRRIIYIWRLVLPVTHQMTKPVTLYDLYQRISAL